MAWAWVTGECPNSAIVLAAAAWMWASYHCWHPFRYSFNLSSGGPCGMVGVVAWTRRYPVTANALCSDTIYASQDKKDDVKAGVKSAAVTFAAKIKAYLIFFGSNMMLLLVASGILNNHSIIFYAISVFGGVFHLGWQLQTIDVDSPRSCWKAVSISLSRCLPDCSDKFFSIVPS